MDPSTSQAAGPSAQRLMAELEFLSELCKVVASNSELQPILDWIVRKTTVLMSADEGAIKLLDPKESSAPAQTLIRRDFAGADTASWPAALTMSVMGFLMVKGEPLASSDLAGDPRFPSLARPDGKVRAMLAVPLRVGNHITGLLAVTQAKGGRLWTQDEIQLLTIVAANSASVIEQARLRVEEIEKQRLEEESRRMERELQMAREMQMSLVPSEPMALEGWEIRGRVVPARQVGGDAFDYFRLESGNVGIVIADVVGKGVPAALLMSNAQASLRAYCHGRSSIPEALQKVNQSVARSVNGKSVTRFITLFYAEFDPATGHLRYANAGHNYPLVRRRDGSLEPLSLGGIPIGILEEASYEQGETSLSPGDSLLLYSDGITEAMDAGLDEFGEERLEKLWREQGHLGPERFIPKLFSAIEAFRGQHHQTDDITLVVLGAPSAPGA